MKLCSIKPNMPLKAEKGFYLLAFVFLLLYMLIAFVNHFLFRTYALDLGAYTHALYDYRNFELSYSALFSDRAEILLADHFDLYLMLFAPFSFIFGTYSLILIQLFSVLAGAYGTFRYFQDDAQNHAFSQWAAVFYFLFFGVFSALSFDYHSNVVAASLLPWFFYCVKKNRFSTSAWLLFFILIAKENLSLWMVFVMAGLMFRYPKSQKHLRFLGLSMIISLLYFITITFFVMPALSQEGVYPHFHYSGIGSNAAQAVRFIFGHPLETIKMLFSNHTLALHGDGVKTTLFLLLFFSGLPFLLFRPYYLLMLIPIFLQKLLHDNPSMWGAYGQYSIEFLPVLAIGAFESIAAIRSSKWKKALLFVLLAGTLGSSIHLMDKSVKYGLKERIRFYQAAHYRRNFDVREVHRMLRTLPADAAVSAQSAFVPHLALRKTIYQFPIVNNARYIVLSEHEDPYPLNIEKYSALVDSIIHSPEWLVFYEKQGILVLERRE